MSQAFEQILFFKTIKACIDLPRGLLGRCSIFFFDDRQETPGVITQNPAIAPRVA
jgi:hypothetical protein